MVGGMPPLSWLEPKLGIERKERFVNVDGMCPVRLLFLKLMRRRFEHLLRPGEILPIGMLPCILIFCICKQLDNDTGIPPSR